MPDQNASDSFGEVIFAYTRAQAIADGFLVDVSDCAKRFAIRFPVALTAALYQQLRGTPIPTPPKISVWIYC